jgi:hypothetical protein
VRGKFFDILGLVAGFIICGAIGGAAVLSAVPELRDKCSSGLVCGTLRLIGIISTPPPTAKPTDPPATPAGCLSPSERNVLYRMSLILIGNTPSQEGGEVPSSLGLPKTGCVPIEEVASKICASLAREWALSGDPSCDFPTQQIVETK